MSMCWYYNAFQYENTWEILPYIKYFIGTDCIVYPDAMPKYITDIPSQNNF